MHCNTYNWLKRHLQSCRPYLTFSPFAWTDLNVNRGRDLILIKRIEQNIIYKVMGVRGVD